MLSAHGLRLGYGGGDDVVDHLTLELPEGRHTVVIGPNGCGKSTLLRGLAGLLRPRAGAVSLDGEVVHQTPRRELARRLALLPQGPLVPEGLSVKELVARGRHPHQRLFVGWSDEDERVVEDALQRVDLSALSDRPVETLSGGQRQRAWVALVLAQRTGVVLLDEPTTYLDLAHACEVLRVVRETAADGHTVVSVLHDLSLAARFADEVVVMDHGRVVVQGSPGEVFTPARLHEVFGLHADVIDVEGRPVVAPLG